MGDPPLDAFRHELLVRVRRVEIELVLEVAIAAAAPHRPDRTHAAVLLEASALIQNQLTRALVRAGEQIADHRRARADGQRLRDVAGEADAAVGDHRHVVGSAAFAQSMIAVIIGTPMPATMRVVQIDPAPMPTLTASTP